MANPEAPSASIDWAAAEVRGVQLTLPLRGRLSAACIGHLSDLAYALPQDNGHTIAVSAGHITVTPIRRGGASDVHQLLERLVHETNVAFATEEDARAVAERERRTRVRSIAGSLGLMVLAGAAVALQWVDWGPLRVAVVVAFVAIAPGWAILRLWNLAQGWAGLAMSIALSISMALLLATATVYAGVWSPTGSLIGLASVTVLAAAVALWRSRRAPQTASGLARP